MRCEDCQPLLLDLAYGELDEARAAEVRSHVERCASCEQEWSKLERGRSAAAMLPVASAPPASRALLDAIERAAQPRESQNATSGAADRSGARASATARVADDASKANTADDANASSSQEGGGATVVPLRGGARWIERLAAMAMRREVAMAAVFLMALGVGVTTLYNPSRNPAVTEEERPRDVIPAVEVSAEQRSADERSAQRRGISADPSLRVRAERPDTQARAARVTAPASAQPNASPTPTAAPNVATAGARRSDQGNSEVWSGEAASQNAVGQAAQRAPEQQSAAFLQRGVASNAGVEVAGVQQQATPPAELAARGALERGDTASALQQFRVALANATDDVSRARIQRQIASLEATQAAAAASQTVQAASAQTVTHQTIESSVRRSRAAPARATNRARSGGQGGADSFNALGY
jgi:Putative zinc-finger